MRVCDDLKARLVDDGRPVTEIAKKLEVGRPAVSNMLNGRASISIEMALKIEMVFGLSAHEILHRQLDEQIADAKGEAP